MTGFVARGSQTVVPGGYLEVEFNPTATPTKSKTPTKTPTLILATQTATSQHTPVTVHTKAGTPRT